MSYNTYFLIGSFISLIISVALLTLSTYEIGNNENDKNSTSYTVSLIGAKTLSIISVISLIVLLYTVYNSKVCSDMLKNSVETAEIPTVDTSKLHRSILEVPAPKSK